ncbi:MAG: hypothetical protein RLZZ34_2932, partial [Verrucomicrobiota bacterium]
MGPKLPESNLLFFDGCPVQPPQ